MWLIYNAVFSFTSTPLLPPSNEKCDKVCILLMENAQSLAQLWTLIQGRFSNKKALVQRTYPLDSKNMWNNIHFSPSKKLVGILLRKLCAILLVN